MAVRSSTSPEMVQAFSNDCKDQHDALMQKITALKAREDALTATWTGQARHAFDTLMERYYEQARRMNEKLYETTESLTQVSKQSAAQDEDRASQVQAQVSSLDLPGI